MERTLADVADPFAMSPAPELSAFDVSRRGTTTGAAPAYTGVWSEFLPQSGAGIADCFAQLAANRTDQSNPHLKPLVHRADNPARLTLRGDESNGQIAATLLEAWDAGHDAVLRRNFTRHGGKSGDALVVRDPAQLRSPFAKLDPAKKDVSDLLATLAVAPGAGAIGAAINREEP